MKKKLKLMTDYECYPLWEYENNKLIDNPAPNSLPLSRETIARLEKWSNDYDSILNLEDPASSGFSNQEEEQAFELEGINLWHTLREELGADYEVVYYSYKLNKIFTEFSSLLTT